MDLSFATQFLNNSTFLGASITAAIGIFVYALKKYIDWKIERASVESALLQRFYVERQDTIAQILGMLSDLEHNLQHVSHSVFFEPERSIEGRTRLGEQVCKNLREKVRHSRAYISEEHHDQVIQATNSALNFLASHTEQNYKAWVTRAGELTHMLRAAIMDREWK